MTAPWRDREPFGPLVYRSSRGVLHRARSGPRLHERCRAGKPLIGSVISDSEAVAWATGHPAVLCRYPWCFRETVRAAGLDPEVGHAKRAVHRRRERPARRERHRPTPVEAHDHTPGWWWCSCGRIVIRATDMHNPHRSWWAHKATGYRTPQGAER